MSRIVSVWLKGWPIARLLRAQASAAPAEAINSRRPLVLVAPGKGGPRIVALNRAARQSGLVIGDLLSNARSKVSDVRACDADPVSDAAALNKLALWGLRYSPIVAPWDQASGADGLFLDISGCAHLFGGEAQLLADLADRLRSFGLLPRLAIADWPGASWAVARFGRQDSIVPRGGEADALRALPLAALRLSQETQSLMRRLGFRRIGDVMDQPRAPFAARLEDFLRRLDQALGRAPEPLTPIAPPPVYRAQRMFLEPLVSADHVCAGVMRLLRDLVQNLARDEVGARVLRLLLFRVDGRVLSLDVGLACPSRDPEHIARLIALRLDRLGQDLDAEFGFEVATLDVLVVEPLPARQAQLAVGGMDLASEGLGRLIDRLRQRLGPAAVRCLRSRQSHIPERAQRLCDAAATMATNEQVLNAEAVNAPIAARPLLLLPHPEAADVMAVIPDGPPRRFRWRGIVHQVTEAEGPERIAPEWWRHTDGAMRDYYVVEDSDGHRYWLYREGLYGRDATPHWFVHGVFA